jgi:hypothetical protein
MRTARALVVFAALLVVTPAAAAPPTVHASVDRRSVGLGDAFRYTVEAREPGPEAPSVVADAGPFEVVVPPQTSTSQSGGFTVVRVEQTLMCLDRGCLPGAHARRVALPRARATTGRATASAPPVDVTLEPRVASSAVAAPRAAYRRQVQVPPASTRLPAGVLAILLAGAAAVVAATAFALLARGRRGTRSPVVQGRVAGGLDRALRFLRESAARPAPDRRRAADFAARVAEAHGGTALADEATRTAWAPPEPEPADVGVLADRIERALGNPR